MMAVCRECGKKHVVTWPEFYVYRRGDDFFCSESCMLIHDAREYKKRIGWMDDYYRRKRMKRKITLEQKKKAVEIALKGGTAPLKYLEECGAANPSASWFYIKKTVKEKDPETWEKLQSLSGETEMEMHMAEPPKPVVDLTIESEELTKIEIESEKLQEAAVKTVEEIQERMERKPLKYDGFEVVTIRNDFGTFHYDKKFNLLDWTSPDGEEVSFSPECWKIFATEELPKAMAILGVNF